MVYLYELLIRQIEWSGGIASEDLDWQIFTTCDHRQFYACLTWLNRGLAPLRVLLAYERHEDKQEAIRASMREIEAMIWQLVSARYPGMSDVDRRMYAYDPPMPIWSFGAKHFQPYGNRW